MMKLIILLSLLTSNLAARSVLVVSNLLDEQDTNSPTVEVYDFLSRTWRLFEPPVSEETKVSEPSKNPRKPQAARLINHDSLLELDLAGSSMKTASLPSDVEGSAPFYYGDTLCLAGGYNVSTSELLKDVVCWNPLAPQNTSNWVSLPPMQNGRYKAAAVVSDGKLFVSGGYDTKTHDFLDSVEVFDDVSQKWYTVSPLLNGGKAGHKMAAVNGKLYVMGGWRKFKFLDEVEEYDPIMDQWIEKTKMPLALAYFGSVVKQGQIYIVGGISGFRNSDEKNELKIYSPNRDAWADIQPPMSVLRGKVTAVLASDL